LQSKSLTEQLAAMPGDVEKLHSKNRTRRYRRPIDGIGGEEHSHPPCRSAVDLYRRVVDELIAAGAWPELNDRFYRRSRSALAVCAGAPLAKIVAQRSAVIHVKTSGLEFPCVGTNAMNFFNISRATQGLVAYLHDWNQRAEISAKPKIVIAHDPRFFSNEFCKLTAKIAAENGCDAFIFDGPRSTPELSFAVRHIKATAGIVITASHNPSHDNGYKVYFSDGAQVIEPHASGIIARVNTITSETFAPLPKDRQGRITTLGKEIDEAYMQRLETLILDPQIIREAKSLRIVYSPLHGTGR